MSGAKKDILTPVDSLASRAAASAIMTGYFITRAPCCSSELNLVRA
jgi:hypothetical protein